jgi:hypothetical protein
MALQRRKAAATTALANFAGPWDQKRIPRERNKILRLVFDQVTVDDGRFASVTPRDDFLPYFQFGDESGVKRGSGPSSDACDERARVQPFRSAAWRRDARLSASFATDEGEPRRTPVATARVAERPTTVVDVPTPCTGAPTDEPHLRTSGSNAVIVSVDDPHGRRAAGGHKIVVPLRFKVELAALVDADVKIDGI